MPTESDPIARAVAEGGFAPEMGNRIELWMRDIDLEGFFVTVDNSPYTLADWLRALMAFDSWLKSRQVLERPVTTMIGYLECCTLMLSGSLSPPDFASLVVQNLNDYGFAPDQDAKICSQS